MNAWSFVMAGYLLTGGSVLVYLFSLNRREKAVMAARDILKRRRKDTTG